MSSFAVEERLHQRHHVALRRQTTNYASKLSSSESQSELEASDGMRRSRAGSETEPTFGPSGIAERFELLREEAAVEHLQPANDGLVIVKSPAQRPYQTHAQPDAGP